MKLNALLMCSERESLTMLADALQELAIDQEACVSERHAMELLALGYYSGLLVDFDLPGAAQVVHMARLAPAQRRPVVFAVISGLTDVGNVFQAGANFVFVQTAGARAGVAFAARPCIHATGSATALVATKSRVADLSEIRRCLPGPGTGA